MPALTLREILALVAVPGGGVRDAARADALSGRARPGRVRAPVRAVHEAFRGAAQPGLTVAVGQAVGAVRRSAVRRSADGLRTADEGMNPRPTYGAGNTVVTIEHDLDVVRASDWLIDLGPTGGTAGGSVVAEGTPEEVAGVAASRTGAFLRSPATL